MFCLRKERASESMFGSERALIWSESGQELLQTYVCTLYDDCDRPTVTVQSLWHSLSVTQ